MWFLVFPSFDGILSKTSGFIGNQERFKDFSGSGFASSPIWAANEDVQLLGIYSPTPTSSRHKLITMLPNFGNGLSVVLPP